MTQIISREEWDALTLPEQIKILEQQPSKKVIIEQNCENCGGNQDHIHMGRHIFLESCIHELSIRIRRLEESEVQASHPTSQVDCQAELEEWKLRFIEATNPGIDMEKVKARRSWKSGRKGKST